MPSQLKLTISINAGAIDIDASGTKGGNIRGEILRRVRWVRGGTVDRFDLRFERLEDADGALAAAADWPFLASNAQPRSATVDEDAGTVVGAEQFGGRLADPGVYKYSVTAYEGGHAYTLDPIIIIER
jgi:hypothetical protein